MHIHYTYICASVSVYVYFILIHSYNLNLFLQLCSHHLQHFLYSSFHMYVDDFRRDEKFVYSRMISISTRRVLKIIIKKKFPDEGDIHNLPPICVRRDRGREDDKEKKIKSYINEHKIKNFFLPATDTNNFNEVRARVYIYVYTYTYIYTISLLVSRKRLSAAAVS